MNIIITSDNLKRSLSIDLRSWRAPLLLLIVIAAIAVFTHHTAVKLAERWALERDPRVQQMVRQHLAQSTAERNELWQSTIDRLEQEVTDLQIKLWRLSALGNEIADRLGLEDEIKVNIEKTLAIPKTSAAATPGEELSELESIMFDLLDKLDGEDLRLNRIGANTSAFAMQRSTVPMRQPIEGRYWITSGFGTRKDPFTGRRAFHSGYDFAAKTGTPALAAADGIVTHRGRLGNYGKMIEIYHGDGISTIYGHLHDYRVEAGTFVKRRQVIGLVGSTGRSTGPHLHYEVRKDGKPRPYTKVIKEILEERPLVALSPPEDLLLPK